MRQELIAPMYLRWAGIALLALVAGIGIGCKSRHSATPTDQQIASEIQTKINNESALARQNIQVTVVNGIATLSGTVTDEASRTLAANDSGTVNGVKTVLNNLVVQAATQPSVQPAETAPKPAVAALREKTAGVEKPAAKLRQQSPPASAIDIPQPSAQAENAPPPIAPQPVVKEITIPAGTVIPVRMTETLDTKTAQTNDAFHGALAADIGTQGVIALRRGAPVLGRIVEAREAAHFKGSALLSLELTQIQHAGKKIAISTEPFLKEGAARGKDTAAKAGGGAAVGAIIGAIAGGGKGAAIGGLAGGAAGTGVNAATRGQQVVIPTESTIKFQLQSPIVLRITLPLPGSEEAEELNEPQLQPR